MSQLELLLHGENEQLALAGQLAQHCPEGSVIFLRGDLGTGKTTLVRGFLHALGYAGNVKSPTYTLVEPYLVNHQSLYHFDLYRLGSPDELEYAGGRDYFDGESICLVEWPERAEGYLPVADLVCELRYQTFSGKQGRACTLKAYSAKGEQMLKELSSRYLTK